MRKRSEPVQVHKCTLPQEGNLIYFFIHDGLLVAFRRRIKSWLTISPRLKQSKMWFKSSSAIQVENVRHLFNFYFTIHPFSEAILLWQFMMLLTFFVQLMLTPIAILAVDFNMWELVYLKLFFDVLCLTDVLKRFLTGYADAKRHVIVLSMKRIFLRYLSTYLVSDVLSSMPFLFWVNGVTQNYKHAMKFCVFMKIVRVNTFLQYFELFRNYHNYSTTLFRYLKLLIWFIIFMVWGNALYYLVRDLTLDKSVYGLTVDTMPFEKRLEHDLFYALMHFFLHIVFLLTHAAYGDQAVYGDFMIFVVFIMLIFGLLFQMYFLTEVVIMQTKAAMSSDKYTDLIQQVNEFMVYKELPQALCERIYYYFDFRFQRQFFRETELMSTLSPILREEIIHHQREAFADQMNFFKVLPRDVIKNLFNTIRQEVYLPNDVLIRAGEHANCMYFLSTGSLAVFDSNGKELCHLKSGDYFGEISILFNLPRIAYVVAIEGCEVYRLNKKDFMDVFTKQDKILQIMREGAAIKLRSIYNISINHEEADLTEEEKEEIKLTVLQDFSKQPANKV